MKQMLTNPGAHVVDEPPRPRLLADTLQAGISDVAQIVTLLVLVAIPLAAILVLLLCLGLGAPYWLVPSRRREKARQWTKWPREAHAGEGPPST